VTSSRRGGYLLLVRGWLRYGGLLASTRQVIAKAGAARAALRLHVPEGPSGILAE